MTTITPFELPGELIDKIVDHLHDCPSALRACSILSTSWLPACKFHLYTQHHLFPAVQGGRKSTVKYLLERRDIDVNEVDSDGRTPLIVAAQYGRRGIVELFLAVMELENHRSFVPSRMHPNGLHLVNLHARDKLGHTVLWWASSRGHTAVVRLLLAHDNVTVDDTGG
jgi:hypothetical protein